MWGTALVSALPILGGPFSVLMTEYLPSVRLQRLDEMLRWIQDEVVLMQADLEDRVVLNEQFAELFERAAANAVKSASDEKRRAFAALIANGLLGINPDAEDQLYFVDLLERCRPVHLAVLAIAVRDWTGDYRTVGEILSTEADVATLAGSDLFSWGLKWTDHTVQPHWRAIEVADAGLTPLGERFVRSITMPSAGRATDARATAATKDDLEHPAR